MTNSSVVDRGTKNEDNELVLPSLPPKLNLWSGKTSSRIESWALFLWAMAMPVVAFVELSAININKSWPPLPGWEPFTVLCLAFMAIMFGGLGVGFFVFGLLSICSEQMSVTIKNGGITRRCRRGFWGRTQLIGVSRVEAVVLQRVATPDRMNFFASLPERKCVVVLILTDGTSRLVSRCHPYRVLNPFACGLHSRIQFVGNASVRLVDLVDFAQLNANDDRATPGCKFRVKAAGEQLEIEEEAWKWNATSILTEPSMRIGLWCIALPACVYWLLHFVPMDADEAKRIAPIFLVYPAIGVCVIVFAIRSLMTRRDFRVTAESLEITRHGMGRPSACRWPRDKIAGITVRYRQGDKSHIKCLLELIKSDGKAEMLVAGSPVVLRYIAALLRGALAVPALPPDSYSLDPTNPAWHLQDHLEPIIDPLLTVVIRAGRVSIRRRAQGFNGSTVVGNRFFGAMVLASIALAIVAMRSVTLPDDRRAMFGLVYLLGPFGIFGLCVCTYEGFRSRLLVATPKCVFLVTKTIFGIRKQHWRVGELEAIGTVSQFPCNPKTKVYLTFTRSDWRVVKILYGRASAMRHIATLLRMRLNKPAKINLDRIASDVAPNSSSLP